MAPSPSGGIVIATPLLSALERSLRRSHEVTLAWAIADPRALEGAQVLVTAGDVELDHDLLRRMPNLGLVACATRGYDAIDLDALARLGIGFVHAKHVNHEDVADHALGFVIMHRRALLAGNRALMAGRWDEGGALPNRSLSSTRLGIVGLGDIGMATACRASAFRMDIAWWAPRARHAPWRRADSLEELAASSDALVVAARSQGNDGLISASVIEALGPNGLLVNVSRGHLVDEAALIAALRSGRLGAAALDVFEEEPTPSSKWRDVPNAFLTPHTSGKTPEAFGRMADWVNQAIDDYLRPAPPAGATTRVQRVT